MNPDLQPEAAARQPLPPGSCLLHIGPYKTGSTTLQASLAHARPELLRHQAAYPGVGRRAMRPGWAVLGYTPRGRAPVPMKLWDELATEVRGLLSEGLRVCVSTEDFGSARTSVAHRIVRDLGGETVHVVAVARRLDRLLPSQWQERVKSHDTLTYQSWLERVLGDDTQDREHQRFWASHDLSRTFDRWEPVVGRQRFTVVVLDESDPRSVTRAFEELLGLPEGLLEGSAAANASLSGNATELLRRVNELFQQRDWPDQTYHALIQRGAIRAMAGARRLPWEERIPPPPPWAHQRIRELNEQRVGELASRGVRVIGDLSYLLEFSSGEGRPESDASEPPDRVSIDTAVAALSGAIEAAVTTSSAPRVAEDAVTTATAAELVRALVSRAAQRVRYELQGKTPKGSEGT